MARKLQVEIVGDASSLQRAFKSSAAATESFGGKLAKLGKVAALAAGAAGLGALFVTLRTGLGEWEESAKVSAQTEAALRSTGGAANVTAKQIDDLANSIMNYSGIDDEAIRSGENLLLTFTNIHNEVGKGNDIFNQATKAAVDLSVAFGKDMSSSAILVGKALNDPIKGLTALSRVGVSFTKGQKDQIKALVESGRVMDAQKLILRELTRETGGSAKAIGKTLPGQLAIAREKFNNFAGDLVGKVVPALLGVFGWFGKVAKEFGKAKTFTAKFNVIWQNVKEVAVSLATKLNEFFWSGWTEQIGRSGGPQMGVAKVHEGLLKGLQDVDWGSIGMAILDGIVSGLRAAGRLAERLSAIVSETVGRIDWSAVGARMGPLLATAIAAGFVTITDPSFWANHWQLALAVAIAVFPIGKLAGLAGKIGAELVLAATRGVERFAPALAKGILDGIVLAGQAAAKLGPIVVGILSRAGAVIEAAAKRVFGRLSAAAVFVVKVLGIQAAISAITTFATNAYNTIKSGLGKALDFVTSLPGKIGAALKRGFDAILGGLKVAAGNIAIAILTPLSKLPGFIGDPFTQAIKKIRAWMGEGGKEASTGSNKIVASLKAGMKPVPETIITPFGQALTGAKTKLAGITKAAKSEIGKAISAVGAQVGRAAAAGGAIGSAFGRGMASAASASLASAEATIMARTQALFAKIPKNVGSTADVVGAKTIGEPWVRGIVNAILAGMPQVEGAAKKALQRALAVAQAGEIVEMAKNAGKLLGAGTVQGMINELIGKTPSLKAQFRKMVLDALTGNVEEMRTRFGEVFGSFADAATAAFNAKIAAWKAPSQVILDKLALAKTLSEIGDALGPAAEELMNKIGAALRKGNTKLAGQLEADLNQLIAGALTNAQANLSTAQAALAAAQATGDPEQIAKAEAAVQQAQANLDAITQAQQTALTLLAQQETAAHEKKVAADQARFAQDLANLNKALQDQNLSVQEKHRKILKFLEDEGLGKKVAAELRGKIKAVEEAADALAKAIKDRLSFTTTVTVKVETVNVPPGGIPGKAAGGPVFAGMPYIVGERGPELFVPSRGGRIVPNGATAVASAGGYGAIHVHVGTVIGNDLEGAARELAGPLRRELTRHMQRNR